MKLGKHAATADRRDLLLKDFLAADYRKAPIGYGHWPAVARVGLDWGMLGNDEHGDCVWAEAAHTTMMWNAVTGKSVPFTTAGVLSDYSAVTGFTAADPSTDQGTNMRDALNYRRSTGVVDADGGRHRIGAYVALAAGDWEQLLQALYVFEAVAVGFRMPQSGMDQFDQGRAWNYVGDTNIVGGHDVPVVGHVSFNGVYTVSWGRLQRMSKSFYVNYADEAYGLLSPEMLAGGKSREGFDLAALQQAVSSI